MGRVLPWFLAIWLAIWSGGDRGSAASLFRLRFLLLGILTKDSLSATDALEIFI